MNRKLVLSALAAATLAIGNAGAGTSNTTFTVQITVSNSCTVAVNTLTFPATSTLAAAIPGSTTGSVTCTGNSPVAVSFDDGLHGGGLGVNRQMKNTADADQIVYDLYTTAAHTVILGDGATGGTVTIPITPTGGGASDAFSVFGLTAAGQDPKTNGLYQDTVTATVTF
jgi:spore coat protein U-like protein